MSIFSCSNTITVSRIVIDETYTSRPRTCTSRFSSSLINQIISPISYLWTISCDFWTSSFPISWCKPCRFPFSDHPTSSWPTQVHRLIDCDWKLSRSVNRDRGQSAFICVLVDQIFVSACALIEACCHLLSQRVPRFSRSVNIIAGFGGLPYVLKDKISWQIIQDD